MEKETYNQKGNKLKTKTRLPSDIFEVEINQDLIYQVMNSQRANQRQGNAKAKDRSEKSGGGSKPWAQKGTGRARHGSIRSPIWTGGGATFAPQKEKKYKKKIPQKMKTKALFMILSSKLDKDNLKIVNKVSLDEGKTQELDNIISNILGEEERNAILILEEKDEKIKRAANNIPNFKVMEARNISPLDLLSYKYLIATKGAIKKIKKNFSL